MDESIRLVMRTPIQDCTHANKTEVRKNRFKCPDCGWEYRMVRQSVLRRRGMLR